METLQEYVLIAQARRRLEHYAHADRGTQWLLTVFVTCQETLPPPIAASWRLAEVYDEGRAHSGRNPSPPDADLTPGSPRIRAQQAGEAQRNQHAARAAAGQTPPASVCSVIAGAAQPSTAPKYAPASR